MRKATGVMNLSIDLQVEKPLNTEQTKNLHNMIHSIVGRTVKSEFETIEAAAAAQSVQQDIAQYKDKGIPFTDEERREATRWENFVALAELQCRIAVKELGYTPKDGVLGLRAYFYTTSDKTANNAIKAGLPPSNFMADSPLLKIPALPEPTMHEKFYGAKAQFNAETLSLEEDVLPETTGVQLKDNGARIALALEEDDRPKHKKHDAWSFGNMRR